MSLIQIQKELKVPKNQMNKFGNYRFRSAEDIIEAAKPICHKHDCALTISDEVVLIGDRIYVKAVATLHKKDGDYIATTGYAREEEVNNMTMKNEHGLNANEIHSYCIYTLRRLFEELTLPAITHNLDLMKIKQAQKDRIKKKQQEQQEQEESSE